MEFHQIISEKASLFNELQKHCDNMKENVFEVCAPITFEVEVHETDSQQKYNQIMLPFLQFY